MKETKKPVVLLCGPPADAVGGGPTHMRNMMASPLKDRYAIVHFLSGSRGTESPAKDEPALHKMYRIASSPFALAWQILRLRPAVVHLNTSMDHKGFWRDFVYLLVSKLLRKRVVLQLHGGSLSTLCARGWMQFITKAAFSIPDAVVVLATSEVREFETLGSVKRLARIPNAVDVSEYRGSAERVHSGVVRRLGYLGRLVETKGILESIDAVKALKSEIGFHDIEFRIAGSGPAQDAIQRRIRELRLDASVRLVGPIYGQHKTQFLQETDIFLFPSYHPEGLPYCILESLAAGTPVVASRVAGIPDVVVDGVHGILVNTRDPQDVVRAVKRLAQSEEKLRQMSQECLRWAADELGLERLARQFTELYETVRC